MRWSGASGRSARSPAAGRPMARHAAPARRGAAPAWSGGTPLPRGVTSRGRSSPWPRRSPPPSANACRRGPGGGGARSVARGHPRRPPALWSQCASVLRRCGRSALPSSGAVATVRGMAWRAPDGSGWTALPR
ncbi:hypothetical protein BS78_03G397900 [Paspalum vaginatum]|nr:hypothetical protein BS78_03G397900 [Paspalum vaginatum]